jgi:hypothetical protein
MTLHTFFTEFLTRMITEDKLRFVTLKVSSSRFSNNRNS